MDTLEKALNFTLISEGWLRNENTYGDAVTIKVRLHSLIVGNNSKYFEYPDFVSLETYLSSMLLNNGNKYQIVNINLDDVVDDFAKVITKIYSRLIFEFAKGLKERASIPFHIVVEEAHRYIQNDTDRFLIGYNIFERIAKEGRKYGVILGLISQRPVELSDTVISQCSNFLIFKMNHPVDVDYIRKMVPNISDEIVEKQKTLQSGTCLGFGMAFRIPLIVKMEMPNPAPWSGNCDVVSIWNGNGIASNNVNNSVNNKTEAIPVTTSQTSTAASPVQNINTNIPVNPFLENNVGQQTVSNAGNVSIPNTANNSFFNQTNVVNNSVNNTNSNMTDDLLQTTGSNPIPTIGGYSLDNQLVKSALPDFATPSRDKTTESFNPNQFLNVPSALDMVANQSTVAPTVKLENNTDDYGSVRIAPPVENNSSQLSNNMQNNSSVVPRTDSGIPLINLVE